MCFDTVNRTWEFTERVHRAQELLTECVLAVQQQVESEEVAVGEANEAAGVECVLTDNGVHGQGQGEVADDGEVKSAKAKVSAIAGVKHKLL